MGAGKQASGHEAETLLVSSQGARNQPLVKASVIFSAFPVVLLPWGRGVTQVLSWTRPQAQKTPHQMFCSALATLGDPPTTVHYLKACVPLPVRYLDFTHGPPESATAKLHGSNSYRNKEAD